MNKEIDVEIERDGLKLHGRVARADGEEGKALIIFHGFGGDSGYDESGFYSRIAKKAVDHRVNAVRFDFSGYGKSEGKFENMDILREMLDAIAVLNYVRTLPFVTDVYLLGHSMGGVIAGMLAGLYPDVVKKLILLAPAASLKEDALNGTCMGTEYDTWNIPDIVLVDGQHHVGGHFFRIARNLPIFEVSSKFTGRALLIHGTSDMLVDYRTSLKYQEHIKDSRLRLYENLDHGIEGSDQDKVLEEIGKFLKEQA